MVAVIKTGRSIRRTFYYNEKKVMVGVAKCIGEGNYPVDVDRMSGKMKLNRLLRQTALNENVTLKSIHVSLNFDPSENLSSERLMEIAHTYMEKIGFGKQPYLVYQHLDAGHPHIHLVTIKVREDGSCIDTYNIGRNQSETARKEIEISFGLVQANDRKRAKDFELKPVHAQRVRYGRSETKRAIAAVLDTVLPNYSYTCLPELNAILRQYNVLADRGRENSRTYVHKGLLYRALDGQGNKVGVPIKASDFHNKPTLKFLEEKYDQNSINRAPHKARVKNAIDLALLGNNGPSSLQELVKVLEKEGISTVLRQGPDGLAYDITYIDHCTKCVFNDSALGKQYRAKAIQERCRPRVSAGQKIPLQDPLKTDMEKRKQRNLVLHNP